MKTCPIMRITTVLLTKPTVRPVPALESLIQIHKIAISQKNTQILTR